MAWAKSVFLRLPDFPHKVFCTVSFLFVMIRAGCVRGTNGFLERCFVRIVRYNYKKAL